MATKVLDPGDKVEFTGGELTVLSDVLRRLANYTEPRLLGDDPKETAWHRAAWQVFPAKPEFVSAMRKIEHAKLACYARAGLVAVPDGE